MKCHNCGKEIADDSRFCECCGTKLVQDQPKMTKETLSQKIGTWETKINQKLPITKKKWFYWAVGGILFIALVVGKRIYYNSDAYEINYVKRLYSIDIPKEFDEHYHYSRVFKYTDGKRGMITISGGNCFVCGVESISQWFEYSAEEGLLLPKESFIQTTINQIPAMYAIGTGTNSFGEPCAYQVAYLYSEHTGCYSIICSYPPEKKGYYDEMMKNVIFSFREK